MQIGQHVVLVDDQWKSRDDCRFGVVLPIKGTVYTVRDVFEGVAIIGPAIVLEEIVNPVLNYRLEGKRVRVERFAAFRFKPLAKLKIEDFIGVREPT